MPAGTNTTLYAGVAQGRTSPLGGLFRRNVGSDRWEHVTRDLTIERVQAISIDPRDRRVVYAGTGDGLYQSVDGGTKWRRLPLPDQGVQIWSVTIHPDRPETVLAGGSPVAIYRSDDRGETWRRLPDPLVPDRVKMPFNCRVMRFAVNPRDANDIYAAIEVNGVIRSRDGGESWEDCGEHLVRLADLPHLKSRIVSDSETEGMLDCHAIAISAAMPNEEIVALRMGLFHSNDGGKSWQDIEVGRFSPYRYGRDVRVSPHDPCVLYSCLSVAASSEAGAIYRSRDVGETWERFDHTVTPTGTMMAVALHPADEAQVYAAGRYGQVFGTQDGGRSWQEYSLPDGCKDVYALACA